MLRYALDKNTGELKHVDDVAKGKACICQCPGCDWPVAAIQPEKNIRSHFRHLPEESTGNERPCGSPSKATESIVHYFVKNFIASQPVLYLPAYKVPTGIYRGRRMQPCKLIPAKGWKITQQVVEDTALSSTYTPDTSCMTDHGTLAVEVYCTNPVDEEKLKKMRGDNLNVIEMNFSDFDTEMLGYTPISQRLQDSKYTHWLNLVRSDAENQVLSEWIKQEQKRIDRQIELEELDRQKELARERQIERAKEELEFQAQIQNIRSALRNHANREFTRLLDEWDASPFLPEERQLLWNSVQSIRVLAEERLPKDRNLHYGIQSKSMTDRVTKEIQEGVKRFKNEVADSLSKQYIERDGQRHVRELYKCGWGGEKLDQPRKYESRGWQDYVDYEITPDFAPFLNEGMYRLGVRQANPTSDADFQS